MSTENQVRLETASVACCGTPAGSVSMDVDVLRCRRDVNTPTQYTPSCIPLRLKILETKKRNNIRNK